jgi:hypothetical protein
MKEENTKKIEEDEKGFWKKLKPSSLTSYTFEIVFLTGLVISMAKFPLSNFMAGDVSKNIAFGWPFSFFELNLQNPSALPLNISGLIFDILIYIVISYLFDLLISSLGRTIKKNWGKKEEKKN